MSGLLFGLMYFAPTLIGWYRVRQEKRVIYSVRQLFLFNLLIARAVVGWFLLLANVRRKAVLSDGRLGYSPCGEPRKAAIGLALASWITQPT
jgi:hypothetical protein